MRFPPGFALALVAGACTEDDSVDGTYGQCLCDAALSPYVRLDDPESVLTVTLFEDAAGELRGYATLDGDIQVFGFDVWGIGDRRYGLEALSYDEARNRVNGRIDLADLGLDVTLQGAFGARLHTLEATASAVGRVLAELVLERIPAPAPEPALVEVSAPLQ